MGSSKTGATGDSATPSSDGNTTKTDTDVDEENDSTSSSPREPCSYSEGERVLAFHSLQLYEAKVIKTDYQLSDWRFYVHYHGWSKNWDEWVGIDRLKKFTEENLLLQKALLIKQGADKSTKPIRASHVKSKTSNVARGKKRKSDSTEEKGSLTMEKLVNVQIPLTLKKQLVDDCEFITHLGKLVKLPRAPNVDDILKKYLDYRLKKDGKKDDSVEEIVKGLSCYFDKALPAMLLYKSERQQYEETVIDDASPSTVYGAEHLLRLFVRLPELLFYAKIEEETFKELQQKLVDFLKFLQRNKSSFFLSTYHVPEDIETSTNKQDG